MKSLRFAAIVAALASLLIGVGLTHGAWAACPSYTVTIPFQTGAVAAGSGTLTDSAGDTFGYTTPAVPAGASFGVPVTLTPASCAPPPASTVFVTGETLGTLRSDSTVGPVGFYILVGSASITVTDLGRWVVSGSAGQHAVSIYDNSCTSLGTATVNTSGVPSGTFAYAPLSPNVVLAAGQHYYVMSAETVSGDKWYNDDAVLTTSGVASVVNAAYSSGGTCSLGGGYPVASGGPSHSYGFPNFKYH